MPFIRGRTALKALGGLLLVALATYLLVYEFYVLGRVGGCDDDHVHLSARAVERMPYGYYNPTLVEGRVGAKYSTVSSMAYCFTGVAGRQERFCWLTGAPALARALSDDEKEAGPVVEEVAAEEMGVQGKRLQLVDGAGRAVGDVRAFRFRGRLLGVGTNGRQPALVDFASQTARVIDFDSGGAPVNKNWTPLVAGGELFFHTDSSPAELLFRHHTLATNRSEVAVRVAWQPPPGAWRGGTNWVEVAPGRYWGLLHSTTYGRLRRRVYRSLWVEVDWGARTARTSRTPLCLDTDGHAPIQFVVGLEVGGEAVRVALGHNDRRALVVEYARADVAALLSV